MPSMQVLAAGLRPQLADGRMKPRIATARVATARGSDQPQSEGLTTARLSHVPLPAAALLITMLAPRELEFSVGIALTPQRLVLLALMPIAFARLLTSRSVTLRAFDVCIITAFAYYWFSLFFKETADRAFQSGSSQFLEAVGGYVIARVYIRSNAQFIATVKLLCALVLIAGAAAAIESLFHVHWIKNIASAMTGAIPTQVTDLRLGLMRAAATFDHPIHYGTFCASVFALAWFLEPKVSVRLMRAAFLGLATLFSLTSAALLGILLFFAGAVWEWTTRGVFKRAWITLVIGSFLYVLIDLVASRSPVVILSTTFVFDADNAYYRLAIWEYGSANVAAHPWIGVSLSNWARPDWMYSATVDHYWLATAISGGLPAAVFYLAGIAILLHAVHHRPHVEQDRCRYAWTAALLVLLFISVTVHFWREIEVYFTFILGMGAWLADQANNSQKLEILRPAGSAPVGRCMRP